LCSVFFERVFVRCAGPACVQCMFVRSACFRHTSARIPHTFFSIFFCCIFSVCLCGVCVCVRVFFIFSPHSLKRVCRGSSKIHICIYIYMYHITLLSYQVTHVNETWHTNYSTHSARHKRNFVCQTWE